ncbi:MAG: ABC transporter ATP-binding protein [Chloroflexi bacterium]|nr:ABC transporter ATP-binding protein [Chloroflexota bacterium]
MAEKASPRTYNGHQLLEVEDLRVYFFTSRGISRAVDGVSFHVGEGETLGVVGESGCGKSVTALGILRLVPAPGRVVGGRVFLEGEDITKVSEAHIRHIRGAKISMILQDPMTSLNPVFSIGSQVGESITIHQGLKGRTLLKRVIEMLKLVRIPAAESRITDYPHQMSGGMRQRVAGAIGISCEPRVLICDEPTTALDVTIQAQYLELLKEVQERTGVALIFITHDMGIIARMCDRVVVMYAGRVVETGSVRDVFLDANQPYTISLLKCLPRLEGVAHLESIEGQPPDPHTFPPACRFAPRCPKVQPVCNEVYPEMVKVKEGHMAACYFPGDWHRDK